MIGMDRIIVDFTGFSWMSFTCWLIFSLNNIMLLILLKIVVMRITDEVMMDIFRQSILKRKNNIISGVFYENKR